MRIESASVADVEHLADAWVALATEQRAHDATLFAEENRQRIRESMAHHVVEDTCLVARPEAPADAGAAFVGFVTYDTERDSYETDLDRGQIENLYVHPDHRGRGVGARLLGAAEDALAERGIEAVTLEVLAANARARAFYDREGYDDHRVVLQKRLDVETDTKGNDPE